MMEFPISVAVDASRLRSGGGQTHLIELLAHSCPNESGIGAIHVWGAADLLSQIADQEWLHKHVVRELQQSLVRQVWWQWRKLKRVATRNDCDILFSPSATTFCTFRPIVVLSQNLLPFEPRVYALYGFRMRLAMFANRLVQVHSLRAAAGTAFLTFYAGQTIQKFSGVLPNVKYIPHGISARFRQIQRPGWPAGGERPIRCISVSNAALYKCIPQVIEAVARLRADGINIELECIGGTGQAERAVQSAIEKFDPDGKYVRRLGRIPNERLAPHLAQADVFVFASLCESMPITLLEAMAAGMPIACSNRGPMPEFARDAALYFDPEQPSEIAAALARIVSDGRIREQISVRAKMLSEAYTWETCAKETWTFVRSCVAGRPAVSAPCRPPADATSLRPRIARRIGREYQVCSRCIMDTSDSNLHFDIDGRCEYCQNFDRQIKPNWHPDERSERQLMAIADKIRTEGRGKPFDCIIGVSGGLDSSYLTYITKEKLGLRPLMFHVDAGWNTDRAVGNIEKLIDGLGLDLYTEVINWDEMRDLQTAFLRSQIAHQDIPQDTAFFATLYKFSRQHGIKYVLTGGNLSTECCREPEEWGAYPGIDKTLILDIHRRFGTIPLRTFPIIDVFVYKIYYRYLRGMRIVKPLDLVPYVKRDAEEVLEQRFGWERFQHKHHESRFTRFFEDYWLPRKFGFDRRRAHFSSLIMTGQMTREEALERIQKPELSEHFLEQEFEYVANKLEMTVVQLRAIFDGENRSSDDYRNKRRLINFSGRVMSALGLERRLYK